jgi:hypothetical protein
MVRPEGALKNMLRVWFLTQQVITTGPERTEQPWYTPTSLGG